ncbi:TatD family hydrolase, partial [Patescibacteria group bacterium]|nr:TatD family hydrolase [Patescibacteria group bacterium]MBU1922507.1 TatD family hydrolase [Patescibacteria group bacterium]
CHFNFNAFREDWRDIVKQSFERGVWMINVGSQASTSKRAVEMAQDFESGVYASVGLHPCHLYNVEVTEAEESFQSRAEEFDASVYRKFLQDNKVVAIGETGLDYHFAPEHADLDEVKRKQEQAFQAQLDLADEFDKPVIIHARDTYGEIINILKQYIDAGRLKKRGVAHCFLGNYAQAKDFIDIGCLISFTGIITFKPKKSQLARHADMMEVIKNIPLEKIMIETDAPYLTPEPYRGKRNLPWYVEEVGKKIAEIKKIDFEKVADVTTKTAREFFGI